MDADTRTLALSTEAKVANLRQVLAQRRCADLACPLSTGTLVRIASEAVQKESVLCKHGSKVTAVLAGDRFQEPASRHRLLQ